MGVKFNTEIRRRDLFSSFLKIGLFTFGGGYAMIPLIEREVVDRRGWVEKKNFVDLLTLAQSIPGPIALNSAAFVGYQSRGYLGALISLLGIVVPSFIIIMIVAIFFNSVRDNAIVEAAFKAMRPVVVALIIAPMITFLRGMSKIAMVVTVASIILFTLLGLSPAILIISAILFAVGYTYFISNRKEAKK
ncbi:MAG: chromate transporter [Rikenellaceae bacterium]